MIKLQINRKLHGPDGDVVLDLDFFIPKGELVTLYGPTGAGKSSVLRMIAGLMNPEKGVIIVNDHTWYNSQHKINLKAQYRNIGMVFQDYSLFPNMTVRENLMYALEPGQNNGIVNQLLDVAGLNSLQNMKPLFLSGGQKQRVALTRALVRKPKILLLDEPLSALDYDMRKRLQDFILQFHQQFDLTTILVSHDLPEIMRLSKRVLVLENGRIKKDCIPEDLLR